MPPTPSTPSTLNTSFAGIPLSNPIVLAAGTCGVIDEMTDVLDLSRVGALITKSITRHPRDGNPTWRVVPLRGGAGMLNAVGLANPGLDAFLEHYAPRAASVACRVFASVAGFSVEDFVQTAAGIDAYSAAHDGCFPAIELNVSCPNVKAGREFGHSPESLAELIREVRPAVRAARLIVKLSPMTRDLPRVAEAAVDAGADALTVANTVPAMAVDPHTRRPRLAHVTGGLSGPAVHPVAVRLIWETYRAFAGARGVPILGLGGVMHWEDAAEFVLVGASAVGVGTALFADPRCPVRIARGLDRWVRAQGQANIAQLVGALQLTSEY